MAAAPGTARWDGLTRRATELYARSNDIRDPFARDYTRILHCRAYRRLKHKTQVFYNTGNDHICTRMEHVAHVESVSGTIASYLGLNTELTRAIATGHDLGHAPFGHQGESVLRRLTREHLGEDFWHERNGLRMVDDIELLPDNYNQNCNLDLTYAVRDGIISHCGEVDENGLVPREDLIDLADFRSPGQYPPATWEGCVVKLSDKIAYLGRDIEDADHLEFLDGEAKQRLLDLARVHDENVLNTTVIIHNMILDVCENSTPETGICLSPAFSEQLDEIKRFNYEHIYGSERFGPFLRYSELVLTELFNHLMEQYAGAYTLTRLAREDRFGRELRGSFAAWLARYCEPEIVPEGPLKEDALRCRNRKLYGALESETVYARAVLDYISGMTDAFAVKAFAGLLEY